MGILESIRGPNVAELEARHDIEGLLKALHHKGVRVRLRAAEALTRLCDPRSVEALIVALKDVDWQVRKAAAEALTRLCDPRSVEALIVALKDADWQVRKEAAEALGRLCDPRSVEALIVALKDVDWQVRKAAADALGELGDKSAVIPLLALLNSTDLNHSIQILKNYTEQGDNGLDCEQIKAHRSKIKMAQEAAARALAKIGDQGVVISLIQTLERLWWLWRSACFLVGNKIKTEEVIRALQDEEEVIRLAILHAVYNRHLVKGSLNTKLAYLSVDSTSFSKLQPEAVGALVNTMDTLDTIIDCSALGHVIGLIKIRSDEERLVEKAIVQALGRLGGGHAKKILTWVCDNSDGLLREIAVAAIEQVEEPETKPEKQAGLLLFCCACGKNLTGTPAMVDRNTDAVYCDKHASSYHSSFRGKFRSCRRCGYRYHLEAGSQIRTCPNCGTALSPGTDPE